jgi:hypothetical protein
LDLLEECGKVILKWILEIWVMNWIRLAEDRVRYWTLMLV